jgi:hypothetical protein
VRGDEAGGRLEKKGSCEDSKRPLLIVILHKSLFGCLVPPSLLCCTTELHGGEFGAEVSARLPVLLVDDESIREFVRVTLAWEGYRVPVAANGQEALKLLQAGGLGGTRERRSAE